MQLDDLRFSQENKTLTIKCGDLVKPILVTIEDIGCNTNHTFQRDGDCWAWFTTMKPIDVSKYECRGVFVNLKTGEKRVTNTTLTDFRSTTKFSPNGKLAIIDAGISASSARKVMVIDLTDWDNVKPIYHEEIWDCVDYNVEFDADSNAVFSYVFKLWAFGDKVSLSQNDSVYDEEFLEYFNSVVYPDSAKPASHYIDRETLLSNGAECTAITHTITRKYNLVLVTPDSNNKWSIEHGDRWSGANKRYLGLLILVNEMDLVSETSVKGVSKTRNNVQIDETNFRNYIK